MQNVNICKYCIPDTMNLCLKQDSFKMFLVSNHNLRLKEKKKIIQLSNINIDMVFFVKFRQLPTFKLLIDFTFPLLIRSHQLLILHLSLTAASAAELTSPTGI